MAIINDLFRRHADDYLEAFGDQVPHHHRQAIAAIAACRTGDLGTLVYACPQCQHCHFAARSCGNRHCPTCQGTKAQQWLREQLEKRLPCPYFMLTFTIPEALRSFVLNHQNEAYSAMFEAAASAIKKVAKDPRHLGCDVAGFCAILHTWGRQLQYHPHLHIIAPAGGIDAPGTQWLPSSNQFFLPVRALSTIFRAVFRERMRALGLDAAIPARVWTQSWNVNCQAVGAGEAAFKYLSRYVFKVAISNERILAVSKTHVSIAWSKVGCRRQRTLRLTLLEFMRRFLQHVLPTGFMKVRYYGFASPNAKISLDDIRELVKEQQDIVADLVRAELRPAPQLLCPICKIPLRYRETIRSAEMETACRPGGPERRADSAVA